MVTKLKMEREQLISDKQCGRKYDTTKKRKAKERGTRQKYYDMDPNNPELSLKMKNLVLKSKRSKAYRDQQNSLILELKRTNEKLTSELAQRKEAEQRLECQVKEKNKIIEEKIQLINAKDDIILQLLGRKDNKELTAATSLIQLRRQSTSCTTVQPLSSSRACTGKGRSWWFPKNRLPASKKT